MTKIKLKLALAKIKAFFISFVCFFFPVSFIRFLLANKYKKKHPFPPTSLIRRQRGTNLFEIEFNWYDEDMLPVSLVREVSTNKLFSIRDTELYNYTLYKGKHPKEGAMNV